MRLAKIPILLGLTGWLAVAPAASAQLLGNLIVNMTSPAAGSTVSATVSLSASVTIVGALTVQGVQFYVDGVPFGAEDRSDPYTIPWNTTAVANGPHTLRAVARDLLGLRFSSSTISVTVLNDTTPPAVSLNQAAGQADPTSSSPILFTAVFSKPVIGFTGADVAISGTAGGTRTVAVSGGPSSYTVAVSGMTSEGSVTATIPAGVASDTAGNSNTASTSTDNTVRFAPADTTAPSVTINQAASQGDPTSSSPILFTAVFSEAVSGFTGPDVAIDGTAGGTKTVTVSGGPSTYTVAVSGMTTDGSVIATIPAGVANDAAGNGNAASSSTDNTVTFVSADSTAPSVTINQAASQADPTSSSPIVFTAVFSEPVSGFTAGDVAISGTAGGTTSAAVSGGPSTYTVAISGMTTDGSVIATIPPGVAGDGAGNGNAASTSTDNTVAFVAASTAPLTWTRFEETDLSIAYAAGSGTDGTGAFAVPPAWFHGSTSRGWSLGTASFNRSTGARATFTFTGTSVRWVSFRAPWAGSARVSVDGEPATEVDLYLGAGRRADAPPCTPQQLSGGCVDEEPQAVVFSRTGLPSGPHTLSIEVTGLRNALAPADCTATTCNAVVVDAFDVGPSGSASPATLGTRFEETAIPADSFTGAWTRDDRTRPWSGGTGAVSVTAGARTRFAFTGTEVRWIGLRGPWTGIARVILDGALHATVDTFSANEVQAVVFAATDLADASHTLEIEVTGSSSNPDPATRGAAIAVDAFDVRSRFEDRDASITYTGSWTQQNMDRAWSGTSPPRRQGTAAITVTPGAAAEFRFSGTAVSWIGMRGPQAGVARVTVDGGAFVADVNMAAPTEQIQTVLISVPGLPDGPHTLRIEKIDAAGSWVVVDALDVTSSSSAPPVVRSQETSASYTGAWNSESMSFWSGGTGRVSATAGAEATFTFTGTSVRWIGHRRSDFGIAHVFIDGVLRGVVDTFAPFEEFQVAVFGVTGLAPGTLHTLTIRVTGTTSGGGTLIVVDAFDVY